MWLYRQLYTIIRGGAAISIPMLLISCSSPSQPEVGVQPSSTLPTLTAEPEISVDETSRAAIDTNGITPAPSELSMTNLRAGYVSVQWLPSNGDTIQSLPGDDAVSYYRVLRNGLPLVDAFSTSIEDTNPPQGEVTYSVQAVKFETFPEFSITYSALIELSVVVPSVQMEQVSLHGQLIDDATVNENLARIKSCVIAHTKLDGSSLCSNHLGHIWPVSISGETGELLPHTSSVGDELYVTVENRDAQFGPIPGIPEWTVTRLATGDSTRRDLSLDSHVNKGERVLVNGVVVSDANDITISGSLYQSYIPRSLGPGPGVLPVTSAYFVVRLNAITGEVIQFKRFPLSGAPGAVASVSNGVLEMFHTGLVTWMDAKTLATIGSQRVTGVPLFSDESAVYTTAAIGDPNTTYYQFAR